MDTTGNPAGIQLMSLERHTAANTDQKTKRYVKNSKKPKENEWPNLSNGVFQF